jgi:hypothetical protein
MWRVVFIAAFVAGTSRADGPDAGSPQDDGVYAWLDGRPEAAVRAQAECAKAGIGRCASLESEMRDFQKLASRGPKLTLDDVEKLASLDRNICEGQTSQMYRKAAKAIAAGLCPRIHAAKARDDAARICELASVALSASPLDECVWALVEEGGQELARLRQMANEEAWGNQAAIKRHAIESYRRLACPEGPFGTLRAAEAPAELEPGMRPGPESH